MVLIFLLLVPKSTYLLHKALVHQNLKFTPWNRRAPEGTTFEASGRMELTVSGSKNAKHPVIAQLSVLTGDKRRVIQPCAGPRHERGRLLSMAD